MSNVVRLASRNEISPKVKACMTCRYLVNPRSNTMYWRCGINGYHTTTETLTIGDCGPQKLLWEPRPQKEGFWTSVKKFFTRRQPSASAPD